LSYISHKSIELIAFITPSVPQQDTTGKQTRQSFFPNKSAKKSSVTWQRLIDLAEYAYWILSLF
jgi:hypothetical protein